MAARPADACPFARPFADEFNGCPAYRHTEFMALDTQYRPLRMVNTCRHLDARSLPGLRTGYYAACALGDPERRGAWVAEVERERLDAIRAIGRDIAAGTSDLTRELWQAKSAHLRATRNGEPTAAHTRRLRKLVKAYEAEAARFFSERSARLNDLHLPEDACIELLREALRDWVDAPNLENSYRPSDSVLAKFPADVHALLRPHAVS
jgi:hypothetical protein